MKRLRQKCLLWILVSITASAIGVPLGIREYLLRTDYAPGFSPKNFRKIKPGDPFSIVLDRLNAPVQIAIISQRNDDSRFSPQYSADVSVLRKFADDASVLLIMRYSKPIAPGGSYHAYEVWVSSGKVQETRTYNYWD